MAAYEALCLFSLLWIVTPAEVKEGKETSITCLVSEDCVLPCQFQSDGKGARVMWYKKKAVVSCTRYGNTSFVVGHNSPAEKYVGRTGLYADQVLEGNATLVLRNVTPIDQGKYFCITMTAPRTDESGVISLIVKAPVREVDIELSGDSVSCRAEGIFPAPTLTWSIHPPTEARLIHNKTNIQKNKLGFYEIQSSLRLMQNDTINQTCVCCVSSDTNKKTAFLKHEASILAHYGGDVMLPCSLPYTNLHSFNLTWRFNRSDIILAVSVPGQRSPTVVVSDEWRPRVSNELSARKFLQLHRLTPELQGAYICEVSTPEEMYVTWTDVTVTKDSTRLYICTIVVLSFFLLVSYGVIGFLSCKVRRLENANREEVKSLNDHVTGDVVNVDVANHDGVNGDVVNAERVNSSVAAEEKAGDD